MTLFHFGKTCVQSRLQPFRVSAQSLCVGLCLAILSAPATGQIIAEYDAGTGSTVFDPVFNWLWTPQNIAPVPGTLHQGVPVPNDVNSGLNAWTIDDHNSSTSNPFYSECIDAPLPTGACGANQNRAAALQNGWRFSARARYVADYNNPVNDIGNMGLSVWLDNKGYFVLFDLTSGNLRATTFTGQNTSMQTVLTSGGTGIAAYHNFALTYNPATAQTVFEFDGLVKGVTVGQTNTHDNAMLWGNISSVGQGSMNFHEVEFRILRPGDYNRNGVVDTADYTVWRDRFGSTTAAADGNGNGVVDAADYLVWKSHFGTAGSGSAPSNNAVAPEPSAFALGLSSLVGLLLWFSRQSVSTPFEIFAVA